MVFHSGASTNSPSGNMVSTTYGMTCPMNGNESGYASSQASGDLVVDSPGAFSMDSPGFTQHNSNAQLHPFLQDKPIVLGTCKYEFLSYICD